MIAKKFLWLACRAAVVVAAAMASLCASADVVINEENFPDANFRAYVSTLQGGGDGRFTPEELAAITEVNCPDKSIASLKGVEHFKLLQKLICYKNQLTSIDLSQNTALQELRCYNNQLGSLDVSQNTALTRLDCNDNQLDSLDVSQNTALTRLDCYNNQLTSLDVSQKTALTKLYCFNNQLGSLDVSQNTALKELWCYKNQLTSLDVSQNTALTTLDCYSNQLTRLDVSHNTALKELWCYKNQLTSLDVSQNTALTNLRCYNNQLVSIDLSQNTALTDLQCYNNSRTVPMYYYMENGNKVTVMPVGNDESNPLYADGFRLEKASNWTNASVTEGGLLVVADTTQAVTYTYNTGLAGKDVTFTIKKSAQDGGECLFINEENFPDANFRAYVSTLQGGGDGVFTPEELAAITKVDCPYKSIASLKGIEHFKLLQNLKCYNNQLDSLDVSQNTALTTLYCNSNQLTSLDLSQNTALTNLYFSFNQLKSLDLSQNKALTYLQCYNNQLGSLDVSQNTALTELNCSSNQLGSLDLSQNTALQELRCYNNQLGSLDVSQNTALTRLDCNDNQLDSLDVSQNTALTRLDCYNNQLTSLDVSQKTALTKLYCFNNQLGSLDVSQNTALKELWCYKNQLTSLDVSQNTALTTLDCYSNQLTRLDVSHNTALKELWCYKNQLTSLDVSQNTALTNLRCYNNQLVSIDLSQNTALTDLQCYNNSRTVPMYYYMENGNKVTVMPVGNDESNPLYADGFRLEKASNWTNASVTEGGLLVVADTTQAVTYTYNTGLAGKDVTFTIKKSAQDGGECLFINEENFPDANFRAYVSTLQGGGDGVFTPEELAAITKVDCPYKSIASLKGIEHFKLLQNLKCYNNQLVSIDLSQNTALTDLQCYNNSRTVPMYYYMENGNKVTVMPVGNDESNPLYADGFRLEKASNWTNAEVRTIDGKQVLVVTDTTQPVTYTYNTGNQKFPVSFTIRWCVDVNGDGKIDTADVSALINVVLGNIEGDSDACDVNFDGVVDVFDVSALVGMIYGNSN